MNRFNKIIIIVLITLLTVLMIIKFSTTSNLEDKYFKYDVISSTSNLINDQYDINNRLDNISNNKKYTMEEPYVELNPYKISPLSAVIIFQSSDNKSIEVYVNDKLETTMELSKKHIIPIYGLKEDYDNKIVLKSDSTTKELYIKTEKSNINYPLNIVKSYRTDDIYFTVASYETYLTGWDSEGNLRFYLTTDNRMDVEFLDNGHFLIGVTQGQVREQFIGFVEMDYLGKIYNYYTLENGYSFEFQDLGNNEVMLSGGNTPVVFDHQVIYKMNLNTGKKIDELDIYDVVKKIDPTFNDKYLGTNALRNGFYYNSNTNDLVVSFREINTIWCFDYSNKTIKWVLTNSSNELFQSDVWKDYLIKVDTKRYPLGQHSPQITSDGYLLYYNNGYDRYSVVENKTTTNVSNYKNDYSSVELLKIDEDKRTAKTIKSYDFNKKYFSIKYGYSRILDNGNYLIDNGYILKDDYRNNSNNTIKQSEADINNSYAKILEIDKNNNIVFEATCEEGKFRAFKHKLYLDNTKNIDVSKLNTFNTIPNSNLEITKYNDLNLDSINEWIYNVDFTKNTFTTNYEIQDSDNIKLYLMNNEGKVYILNYHESNDKYKSKIFNIEIPKDKYVLFIELNNTLYKTNKIYEF